MKKIIKGTAIILSIFKSFFLAITQVAWGLVSLFGLGAVIAYLNKSQGLDITSINQLFLTLGNFIIEHIMLFVIIFLLLYLYFDIKDILK